MAAISIAPSEYWEGNDGSWSTFNVNIGSPAQQMRVLPATSQSSIWVVIDPQTACPNISTSTCANIRGGIFNSDPKQDTTWQPQQISPDDPYYALPLDSEATLPGYSNVDAAVGFDNVNLDWSGPTAPASKTPVLKQVVAGYVAQIPWFGILGISGRPSHIFNATSAQNSTLQTLQQNKNIPGLSFGYTAGAKYVNPPAFGSLTFGGYDAARVNISSTLTLPFGSDSTRDLLVAITRGVISGQTTTNVKGLGVNALIDSMVPEIWLPTEACASFEAVFGLVWNSTLEMYLINDTQHNNLVASNPSVTFFLANSISETNGFPITLRYAAFDLTASYPLAGIQDATSTMRYFPLKRAANSSQIYLGRTFLQEAYLIVNYDNSSFSIGPAEFPPVQSTTNLVTIYPPGYHSQNSGISAGAIAGIVVGAIFAIALAVGLGIWFWLRRRRQRRQSQQQEIRTVRTTSIGDVTTVVSETELSDRMQPEYFKPLAPDEQPPNGYYKAELDATETAAAPTVMERQELDAQSPQLTPGGQRPGLRHSGQVSWGSNGSVVSPVSAGRITSGFGEPSPPMEQGENPGHRTSDSPVHHERQFSDPVSLLGLQNSSGRPWGMYEMAGQDENAD